MKLSEMIKQGLKKKGFRSIAPAAAAIGVSPEILRIILSKDHIPKDKTLMVIAEKLDLDHAQLLLTAHMVKIPEEMSGFLLSPANSSSRKSKRVYPLSEEQCNYLEKIMNPKEIQMIRKYRQITDKGRIQIKGYVDFMFQTQKMPGEAASVETTDQSS